MFLGESSGAGIAVLHRRGSKEEISSLFIVKGCIFLNVMEIK